MKRIHYLDDLYGRKTIDLDESHDVKAVLLQFNLMDEKQKVLKNCQIEYLNESGELLKQVNLVAAHGTDFHCHVPLKIISAVVNKLLTLCKDKTALVEMSVEGGKLYITGSDPNKLVTVKKELAAADLAEDGTYILTNLAALSDTIRKFSKINAETLILNDCGYHIEAYSEADPVQEVLEWGTVEEGFALSGEGYEEAFCAAIDTPTRSGFYFANDAVMEDPSRINLSTLHLGGDRIEGTRFEETRSFQSPWRVSFSTHLPKLAVETLREVWGIAALKEPGELIGYVEGDGVIVKLVEFRGADFSLYARALTPTVGYPDMAKVLNEIEKGCVQKVVVNKKLLAAALKEHPKSASSGSFEIKSKDASSLLLGEDLYEWVIESVMGEGDPIQTRVELAVPPSLTEVLGKFWLTPHRLGEILAGFTEDDNITFRYGSNGQALVTGNVSNNWCSLLMEGAK